MRIPKHTNWQYYLLIAFFCLFTLPFSQAQEEDNAFFTFTDTISSSLELFEDEQALNITLKYDITTFIRQKANSEYLPATLTIHFSPQDSLTKDIRLRSRGNFRKTQCYFPPVMLNFKTDSLQPSDQNTITKLKLVTHCNNSNTYQEYVLLEYLAYKIYNLISPYSFRVRLAHIHYIDTGKKQQDFTKTGFLIEPLEALAIRVNAFKLDELPYRYDQLHPDDLDRVALFQYLIGNDDWYIKAYHNIKFIKRLDINEQLVTIIPYDFDHAGLVDAFYANPQKWVSVETITDREYMGFCREDEKYLTLIESFNLLRPDILKLVDDFQYLDANTLKKAHKYLEEFFNMSKKPKALMNNIKQACREPY